MRPESNAAGSKVLLRASVVLLIRGVFDESSERPFFEVKSAANVPDVIIRALIGEFAGQSSYQALVRRGASGLGVRQTFHVRVLPVAMNKFNADPGFCTAVEVPGILGECAHG